MSFKLLDPGLFHRHGAYYVGASVHHDIDERYVHPSRRGTVLTHVSYIYARLHTTDVDQAWLVADDFIQWCETDPASVCDKLSLLGYMMELATTRSNKLRAVGKRIR